MTARAAEDPRPDRGDLALSVVSMPWRCALTRSVEDVPCSVPTHFALFRFRLSAVTSWCSSEMRPPKTRTQEISAKLAAPCPSPWTRWGGLQGRRQMCSLIRGCRHQAAEASGATMPSSPEGGVAHRPLPPWKAHGQSASMVFRSCPSYRRRKFGSVIVFAAWLAQARQEAGPSLRSERDLTALSLRLVRLTWAVLRILAFHAT